MTRLLGPTWDHPRATDGLYAATAAFRRANPGIDVRWETHPLRGFESTPIEELAARYDLIVLDHPFMGDVASSGCLLDLSADGARLGLDGLRADVRGRHHLRVLGDLPVDRRFLGVNVQTAARDPAAPRSRVILHGAVDHLSCGPPISAFTQPSRSWPGCQ